MAGGEAGSNAHADQLASPAPVAATISMAPCTRAAKPKPKPKPEPQPKQQPKREAARELVDDEGFGEVFGPGLEVNAQLLLGFGVPRSTFGNWVTAGVLVPGRKRGTYWTTKKTLARFCASGRAHDRGRVEHSHVRGDAGGVTTAGCRLSRRRRDGDRGKSRRPTR
jgi:hypothetical protein